MNKDLLGQWLIEDLNRNLDNYYPPATIKERSLQDALKSINNNKTVDLPVSLPKTPEKMIPVLRKHFKNNVTFISLVLNHYFLEEFFFYRVSKLEPEIFQGFEFFSEIVSEFEFSFAGVGTKGFDNYLELNEKLMMFARRIWPESKEPQRELSYFLYQGLGDLFLEKSDYHRYWVMACD